MHAVVVFKLHINNKNDCAVSSTSIKFRLPKVCVQVKCLVTTKQ